ncbi:MAG: alkaline phosphatase family protein [Gemmatimonadota bacterium]
MRVVRKVIVVGLDGLEPTIVEQMLQAGELPYLARLRAQGSYQRLGTTTPAQTPVAWSTFATGLNPGGHGIFDFLRRDPATYLPDLSLSRYEQTSALLPPRAVNLRRGGTIWEALAARGIPSTVIRCPGTYPPERVEGRMLAGMGIPDLRGGLGTSTLITTDKAAVPRESEQVVPLQRDGDRYLAHLVGPRDPRHRRDLTLPISVRIDYSAATATLTCEGDPRELTLRLGQWSGWLRVKFRAGLLTRVAAVMRVLLLRTEPHVELYVSPANFDPHAPLYPISAPADYASELSERLGGAFYTAGMVEDHAGLANGRYSEETFLSQCEDAMREREAMLRHELDRLREGLLFVLFDTPDRVQHMFWRFREPDHPANAEDRHRGGEFGRVIEDHYRRCDEVVGEALRAADDETLVLVLSDHGFSSFQRGVNLNNWLHAKGYLALRRGEAPTAGHGDFFRSVDWERTKAYALGLGSIYLNLAGRERDGIVPPSGADALARRLSEELAGLPDPARAARAIVGARTGHALYRGPFAEESPDVVVNFNVGYRVSWNTALGGFGDELIEDNQRRWGGDHIVAPELVPGVLFSSRALNVGAASMVDLAPTILRALGVPPTSAMEGTSLLR